MEALRKGDRVAAGSAADRLWSAYGERPTKTAAQALLRYFRVEPGGEGLLERARRFARDFPEELDVLGDAAAALVAAAQRRPPDAPPLTRGASAAAREVTEKLLSVAKDRGSVAAFHWQLRANALRLSGRSHDEGAELAFERGLALSPDDASIAFDQSLFFKWRGRWDEALAASEKAAPLGRGAAWNLALAATALGDGRRAAEAWRAAGIPVPEPKEGQLPIVPGAPPLYVRVPVRGSGHGIGPVPDHAWSFELLSVAPLSPGHGVVESASFQAAPCDYGDVVLWDGAPVATAPRWVDGARREVPVFPLLEVLRRGDEKRYRFIALEQRRGDLDAMVDRVSELGDVQLFRGADASGHDDEGEAHRVVHGKLVTGSSVAPKPLAARIAELAREGGRFQIALPSLYEALGDSKRAGQEHQAWRGIERLATRRRKRSDE